MLSSGHVVSFVFDGTNGLRQIHKRPTFEGESRVGKGSWRGQQTPPHQLELGERCSCTSGVWIRALTAGAFGRIKSPQKASSGPDAPPILDPASKMLNWMFLNVM